MTNELEEFWGDILSEEPIRIVAAWVTLTIEEKIAVQDHLERMATEPGWATIQREAAQVALLAIADAPADAGRAG